MRLLLQAQPVVPVAYHRQPRIRMRGEHARPRVEYLVVSLVSFFPRHAADHQRKTRRQRTGRGVAGIRRCRMADNDWDPRGPTVGGKEPVAGVTRNRDDMRGTRQRRALQRSQRPPRLDADED